jgi:hypothetical protein
MRKYVLIFVALLLSAMVLGLSAETKAGGWLAMVVASGHQTGASSGLVVQIRKKKHDDENNNNDQQGERSCPPGYVVLDKPSDPWTICVSGELRRCTQILSNFGTAVCNYRDSCRNTGSRC